MTDEQLVAIRVACMAFPRLEPEAPAAEALARPAVYRVWLAEAARSEEDAYGDSADWQWDDGRECYVGRDGMPAPALPPGRPVVMVHAEQPDADAVLAFILEAPQRMMALIGDVFAARLEIAMYQKDRPDHGVEVIVRNHVAEMGQGFTYAQALTDIILAWYTAQPADG